MNKNERFNLVRKIRLDFAEVGPRGGIKESPKAPKSDTPNPDPKGEGTAKGDASGKRGAKVTEEQEKTLQNKVDEFNEKESNTKNGRATLGALKSVFQRGLGAFNVSHSPRVQSAEQWAYARVNAFLYLLKNGRPENPKYTTDYDLLPKGHPKEQMKKEYEEENPCWEGYEPQGMKDKDGRMVPNCVPVQAKKVKQGFPIPSPSGEEDESAFIGRCMKEISGEYDQDQALAICYKSYRGD